MSEGEDAAEGAESSSTMKRAILCKHKPADFVRALWSLLLSVRVDPF
jgi:hypothetical protein